MALHTNTQPQYIVNDLVPSIKATCDDDKFEKFELLRECFKSFGDKCLITTNGHFNDGSFLPAELH